LVYRFGGGNVQKKLEKALLFGEEGFGKLLEGRATGEHNNKMIPTVRCLPMSDMGAASFP
jgi:hypothetical protein